MSHTATLIFNNIIPRYNIEQLREDIQHNKVKDKSQYYYNDAKQAFQQKTTFQTDVFSEGDIIHLNMNRPMEIDEVQFDIDGKVYYNFNEQIHELEKDNTEQEMFHLLYDNHIYQKKINTYKSRLDMLKRGEEVWAKERLQQSDKLLNLEEKKLDLRESNLMLLNKIERRDNKIKNMENASLWQRIFKTWEEE